MSGPSGNQLVLFSRESWCFFLSENYVVPRHTLLTIYRSLVAPYLTYGLTAWGQAYKSHLEKLLKLLKFLSEISMQFLYLLTPVFYR